MHVFVVCVWGGGGGGAGGQGDRGVHASVCVGGRAGGGGVMKWVYPYVFVSALGSYDMGRHK